MIDLYFRTTDDEYFAAGRSIADVAFCPDARVHGARGIGLDAWANPARRAWGAVSVASGARLRGAAIVLAAALPLACAGGGSAFASGPGGAYAGVFVGAGRVDGRIVDVDGFARWGMPGATAGYRRTGVVAGALIGRRFGLGGARLRVELDAGFGGLSAKTDGLDPPRPRTYPTCLVGGDETAAAKFRWTAAVRAGIEWEMGPATVFAAAGPAVARIEESLTDLDQRLDPGGASCTQWMDDDDSFRGAAARIGWTIGLGVETPLAEGWTLRLEAAHLDFGRRTYAANLSGDGRCCGPGTERRPVSFRVANRLGVLRLGIVRRFDW